MSHEHQHHEHGHKPHHEHGHEHRHEHGHEHGHAPHQEGHGHQHLHNFFDMEDILQRDYELKKDRLVEFIKKAGLKEGQHVLEIGCGFAPLLELYCDIVGPGGSVTLTDPEPRLADRLAPRLAGRLNACFVAAHAEDLTPIDDGNSDGFDVVVMVNVYHHLTDPEAVLPALHRRLRARSGRLIIFDFVHDTFRIFVSAAATPAAAAAQARLAELIRPQSQPVTALCATRLERHGFVVRLSDCYVLQDRFNNTPLGDFYSGVFAPHALERLVRRGSLADAQRAELLSSGLAALREDPDCVLFSEVHVMLAADAV